MYLDYKQTQIIKQALQLYLNRSDATETEIDQEKRLLEKLEENIEWKKEVYNIPDRKYNKPDNNGQTSEDPRLNDLFKELIDKDRTSNTDTERLALLWILAKMTTCILRLIVFMILRKEKSDQSA